MALPHSGSHLLSQLLGAHSSCLAIGELHNYDKLTTRDREGGGNVISTYADDALFRNLHDLPVNEWHQTIMSRARSDVPGLSTLVDNSKRVSWCASLLENDALEVQPVLLLRDPRALMRFWQLRYNSAKKVRRQRTRHSLMAPAQALRLLTCSAQELYLRKWLIRNQQATRLLERIGRPANFLTYHDLASNPEQTLRRLMPLLGLDYEPKQLRYGEAVHKGTLKAEYQSATSASQISLDVRWQMDLSEEDAQSATEFPALNAYLEKLGLTFSGNGLTIR
jgi:hypothetical protein